MTTVAESLASCRMMRVGEIGDVQLGRQRSPKNRSAEFPTKYLRAANITERGLDLADVLEMDFKPDERERYVLRPGDIILSEASGSASQVGKPAMWNGELPLCCFQNTVIRLRPKHADPKYLLWVFTHFYRNGIFARVAAGVGINHLSASKFKQLEIPVPSLDDQRRIVAEIEKQFTRLDAGVAALRRVQANLKRYRAAVLKAACEGRLVPTEADLAKTKNRKANFETGAVLLARILAATCVTPLGKAKLKPLDATLDSMNLRPEPIAPNGHRTNPCAQDRTIHCESSNAIPLTTKIFSGSGRFSNSEGVHGAARKIGRRKSGNRRDCFGRKTGLSQPFGAPRQKKSVQNSARAGRRVHGYAYRGD